MPRRCTICSNPQRDRIDEAILGGQPLRGISRTFCGGLGAEDSLGRHRDRHLPARLVEAKGARDALAADDLLERLITLSRETREILSEARQARANDVALRALARLESQIELEARLLGQLRDRELNAAVPVEFDEETAVKVAETFLRRRQRPPRALLGTIDLSTDGWKVV